MKSLPKFVRNRKELPLLPIHSVLALNSDETAYEIYSKEHRTKISYSIKEADCYFFNKFLGFTIEGLPIFQEDAVFSYSPLEKKVRKEFMAQQEKELLPDIYYSTNDNLLYNKNVQDALDRNIIGTIFKKREVKGIYMADNLQPMVFFKNSNEIMHLEKLLYRRIDVSVFVKLIENYNEFCEKHKININPENPYFTLRPEKDSIEISTVKREDDLFLFQTITQLTDFRISNLDLLTEWYYKQTVFKQ